MAVPGRRGPWGVFIWLLRRRLSTVLVFSLSLDRCLLKCGASCACRPRCACCPARSGAWTSGVCSPSLTFPPAGCCVETAGGGLRIGRAAGQRPAAAAAVRLVAVAQRASERRAGADGGSRRTGHRCAHQLPRSGRAQTTQVVDVDGVVRLSGPGRGLVARATSSWRWRASAVHSVDQVQEIVERYGRRGEPLPVTVVRNGARLRRTLHPVAVRAEDGGATRVQYRHRPALGKSQRPASAR